MRRLTLAMALSLLPAALAHAQPRPAPTPAPTPAARLEATRRTLFNEANRLADLGRHADALPLFRDAYALFPDARILFNIGLSHAYLDQHLEAIAAYEGVIEDATYPDLIPRAEAGIAASERFITRVTFEIATTDDTPVELSIDGAPWIPLPLTRMVRVAPGEHALRARGGGVDIVAEASVTAIAGASVSVPLRLIVAPPPPVVDLAPPVVETPGPARPSGGFGAFVHLIVDRDFQAATGAIGATFAPHPRVTLRLGGMLGGNNAAFATATFALLAGKLRPTITAGGIVAFHTYDAEPDVYPTMYEQVLVGAHGAIGAEWILSRRVSAIADVALDYYPSANEALTRKTSITPTVGVHARL